MIEDDHVFRTTVASLLNSWSGLSCAQTFDRCEAALELVKAYLGRDIPWTAPDVLLLDVNLPGLSGLDGIRVLKQQLPSTHIVMLTIRDDTETIYASLCAGASGYLLKEATMDQIIESVQQAALGGMYMTPPVAEKVFSFFYQEEKEATPLTEREQEVLQEMAKGYTKKEIGQRLFVEPTTVDTHVRHIYTKLHARNAPHAIAVAAQKNWL